MRRCFQCGAMTDVSVLTRVGDGEFCATCFRALLDAGTGPAAGAQQTSSRAPSRGTATSATPSASPPATQPAPAATHRAPPVPPAHTAPAPFASHAPSPRTCLVCERDLAGEPAVVFLGGEICGPCSAEMAAELESASAGPSTEPSGASGARGTEPLAGPLPDSSTAAPFTPGSETVICAGCERPMPGPGSYRVLRGKPYCAACIPFFSQLSPAAYEAAPEAEASAASTPASPLAPSAAASSLLPSPPVASSLTPSVAPISSVPASSSPLARPGQCDCCRRALDERAQRREGFELCSACVTSDADLALGVARARHRRALARLRSKLEGTT